MIVQPMFWLLLYSQLFRRITDLPGFGTVSYVDYLTPGVAIMTAFFSGSWAGMGMIEDLDRGVLERFLATPASRAAIVFGRILQAAIIATLQALLILLVGLLLGATNGGIVGWMVILLAAFLTAAGFAGLSHGIALRTRQEASMIAVAQFISLPLLFFSSLLIARTLIPDWMQSLSLLNPVEWAVRAARGEAHPRHRLGRDGNLPAPARWVSRPDDDVRDTELPLLPAHALSGRTSPRSAAHRAYAQRDELQAVEPLGRTRISFTSTCGGCESAKTTARATSSATSGASSGTFSKNGVSTIPGAITVTRTPVPSSSSRADSPIAWTACLVAEYSEPGMLRRPATEPVRSRCPFDFLQCGHRRADRQCCAVDVREHHAPPLAHGIREEAALSRRSPRSPTRRRGGRSARARR